MMNANNGLFRSLTDFHASKRETVRSARSVLRFQMVGKLLQVLQYGKTIIQRPEEETQDQAIALPQPHKVWKLYSPPRKNALA